MHEGLPPPSLHYATAHLNGAAAHVALPTWAIVSACAVHSHLANRSHVEP
jgi:hypothetical protein